MKFDKGFTMVVYCVHTRQYIRPQRQHANLAIQELKKYTKTPGAIFGELLYNGDPIAIIEYSSGEITMSKQYQEAATNQTKTPYVRSELKKHIVDNAIPFSILSIAGPETNTIVKPDQTEVQVKQYTLRIGFEDQYTTQYGLSKEMILYIEWDKHPTSGRNKFLDSMKQELIDTGSSPFLYMMEKKTTNNGRIFYTIQIHS